MNLATHFPRLFAVILLLTVIGATGASGQDSSIPVEKILRSDGTLDLSSEFNGSLDIEGWRIILDSTGRPRFVPSQKSETAADPLLLGDVVGDENWDDRFGPPGINGPVYSAVVANGKLYVGGRFNFAGSTLANNIAIWDGTNWRELDAGTNGPVLALAIQGNYLVVAGAFSNAGPDLTRNISRWNITTSRWEILGDFIGVRDTVYAMAISGNDIFIGGRFTTLATSGPNVQAARVARWNGTRWFALGSGADAGVRALAIVDGILYAGGDFNSAGGVAGTRGMARWDGTAWGSVGGGITGQVAALATDGTTLYAGGTFTTAGGVPAANIARYTPGSDTWSAMGAGLDARVNTIALFRNEVYAGGLFNGSSSTVVNAVARFDAGSWVDLEGGVGDNITPAVYAMAPSDSGLYIGGRFLVAGTLTSYNIALWRAPGWSIVSRNAATIRNLSGVDGGIFAVVVQGDNLYIGGDFSTAGGVHADRVARWESGSNSWTPLGSGITDPGAFVRSMVILGNELYVGGIFSSAGGVASPGLARWNTTSNTWSTVDGGMGGTTPFVFSMTKRGADLLVTGAFSRAGSVDANRVARWNGSAWSALGAGITGDTVYVYGTAIAAIGDTVYVGGNFSKVANNTIPFLARWDGSAWSGLGTGVNSQVSALLSVGSDLYVGGDFTKAGDLDVGRIARWSDTGWSVLGTGVGGGTVQTLAQAPDGSILVGGDFITAGGSAAKRIARWNGSGWSALGSGTNGPVRSIATTATDLYAGGDFSIAGGLKVNNIARWDGLGWSALGSDPTSGLVGIVRAIAISGSNVYVGGNFTSVGGVRANNIARWDGTRWSPLGKGRDNGLDGSVLSLAAEGNELFAGGAFTHAGGIETKYIARWDGSAWSALGTGVDGPTPFVFTLLIDGKDLYVGGAFRYAGPIEARRIARWDRSLGNWNSVGLGVDGGSYYTYLSALAKVGTDIYVGGTFTAVGGIPASNIARWDGTQWHSLNGYGTNGGVYQIVAQGDALYVGGNFTKAGNTVVANIARWQNEGWKALSTGMNSPVYDLAIFNGQLYAGGEFNTAGAFTSSGISRWDGTDWLPLGRGVTNANKSGIVYAMATGDNDSSLYVGGDFTVAGGNPSYYFGRYGRPKPAAVRLRNETDDNGRSILLSSRPNPLFSSGSASTTIAFNVERDGPVELGVYDILGRLVTRLAWGEFSAGDHEVRWSPESGLPQGNYIVRLRAGSSVASTVVVVAAD